MHADTPLPAGTVTFLFTDIEGSTRLWEQHPRAMPTALACHEELLRRAIEAHGGHVFKSIGDQLCAGFAAAPEALMAALEAQRALRSREWGETGPLQVRMALHSGEAERRAGDYFGTSLNRVARLLVAGHGGQILLSSAAAQRVRESLPRGASLRDLGTHRLKDLRDPERIFQLLHPELPIDFPPLRLLEAFAHNLPRQLTRFIGREQEMAEIGRLLSGASLLTLTGAGGCGKTRLALQVAADLLEEYAEGVWLVELAALSDPELVPQSVAAALGVREEPDRPLLATLTDYLRPRSLLLVLDNCEHLLAVCARFVDALRRACPQLRVLATSREGLGVSGEQTYQVPPLSLPPVAPTFQSARSPSGSSALLQFEAVQLFRDRAALSEPSFALTEANGPAVAQVCRRLDGMPLAIELAAARLKSLPVEQIAARLDDRFRLLTSGSRTALPRQQTLRALIDWSYDLLAEPERILLRRLAVFAGGWTLQAAETVCAEEPAETRCRIEQVEILDLLAELVNKSLVTLETRGSEPRYALLETIRRYAEEKLLESGENAWLRGRHRDWYLGLAEAAEPELTGRHRLEWLGRLEAEHPNLRAALDWSASTAGEAEASQRLAGTLILFWASRSYYREAEERLVTTLARPDGQRRTVARAKALLGVATTAYYRGDYTTARSLAEESLAIAEDVGDKKIIAQALADMGTIAYIQGEFPRARQHHEKSLSLFRALGNRPAAARSLHDLGIIAQEQGHVATARALYEESLAITREMGDAANLTYLLETLGSLARNQGDYARAHACHQESLAIHREEGWEGEGIAYCLLKLGLLAYEQGDAAQAHARYEESLAIWRQIESQHGVCRTLTCLAAAVAEQGNFARARTLAAEGLAFLRERNDRQDVAYALAVLGRVVRGEGDHARARALYQESLAICRETGQKEGIASALAGLGDLDLVGGDVDSAQARCHESLALFSQLGYRRSIAAGLVALARVAEARRQPGRSACLLGAAQALLDTIGTRLGAIERAEQERCVTAVRDALGEAEASQCDAGNRSGATQEGGFAAGWAEGQAMPLEQAIEYALAGTADG